MILYQVWQGPILTGLIGVRKQDLVHESLNLPVMQLTRAYVMNPGSWSKEEKEEFYKFYSEKCNFKIYKERQEISDNLKKCANDEYMSSHIGDYLKLWVNIGLKNKKNYVEAAGMLMLGAFYPFKSYNDSQMWHPFLEYRIVTKEESYMPDGMGIERTSPLPFLADFLNMEIQEGGWQQVPVLRIFWGGGIYGWLILVCIFYIIYIKNYRFLVPLALIFSLWATVLLAPVVLFRYLYPIVLCAPLMLLSFSKSELATKGRKHYGDTQ